jgi:hypothetical protein
MAETTRYLDWSFMLGTSEAPFVPGSLAAGNDKRTEELMSGRKLTPELAQITGKRPWLKVSLLDPSLVTTWTVIGTTPASVTSTWRTYLQNGGLGTTYKSFSMAAGVLVPLQLSAGATKAATLDIMALSTFAGGTGMAAGTSSAAGVAVAKAYYPTSVSVGTAGTYIGNLISVQHSWNYAIQDDDQVEPSYYYYDSAPQSGSAVCKDLSKVTLGRLEDGSTEALAIVFTDANNTSNTVTVSVDHCKIHAEISGGEGTISWSQLEG